MECRICEYCDHKNDTSFLECEECGADLSFIHPTIVKDHESKDDLNDKPSVGQENQENTLLKTMRLAKLKLVSMKNRIVIDIPFEGGMIGREGTISLHTFEENLYISNEHAEIILKNDGYVVIDRQSTNGTKINGEKLEKNIEYKILPGDEITFANMSFQVEN